MPPNTAVPTPRRVSVATPVAKTAARLPRNNRSARQLRSHRVIVTHDVGRRPAAGVARRGYRRSDPASRVNASHRRVDLDATSSASGGDDGGDDDAEVGAEDLRLRLELSQSFHPSCPRRSHRGASPQSGPRSGPDRCRGDRAAKNSAQQSPAINRFQWLFSPLAKMRGFLRAGDAPATPRAWLSAERIPALKSILSTSADRAWRSRLPR